MSLSSRLLLSAFCVGSLFQRGPGDSGDDLGAPRAAPAMVISNFPSAPVVSPPVLGGHGNSGYCTAFEKGGPALRAAVRRQRPCTRRPRRPCSFPCRAPRLRRRGTPRPAAASLAYFIRRDAHPAEVLAVIPSAIGAERRGATTRRGAAIYPFPLGCPLPLAGGTSDRRDRKRTLGS